MTTWIRPSGTKKISDTFADHKARGSVNPGVDYVLPIGNPVVAVADAKVVGVTTSIAGAGGRMVWLDFGNGYNADYLHLSRVDVKKGQTVKQGTVLGLSGASGLGKERGYGPHLHFSFRKGGKHVTGKGNIDYEAFLKKQTAAPAAAAATTPEASAPVKPAAKPAASKRPALKGSLTVGSSGAAVKYLQSKIGVTADGSFGPATEAAVVKWQRKHNLTADGIVGPATWATL